MALTTSTNGSGPSARIAEVDVAVRAVLAARGGAVEPRPARCAAAPGVIDFNGPLLAVRHAESLSPSTREVRVLPRTVVTPLAHDVLKRRGIALRRGAAAGIAAARSGGECEWAFAIEEPAASGVTAALRRALADEGWGEVASELDEAARWVAESPLRGALVVTSEAALAVWRACRLDGVRAASASDPDAVTRAVRQIGINLLVVESPGTSISWIRQLATAFRRAGGPEKPDRLTDPREACRCGSPR
jgi:hypothetical protein